MLGSPWKARDKSSMLFIMEGMLYNPIFKNMPSPLFSLWLTLFSPFFTASLPLFLWLGKFFCLKCCIDADHFISLIGMKTKSAIADFLWKQCVFIKSLCCTYIIVLSTLTTCNSSPLDLHPVAGDRRQPLVQYLRHNNVALLDRRDVPVTGVMII